MTILEAVIKQTGCYASSRAGRLSVFWGDQIFIPTVPVQYECKHHVDILCSLGPMPSEEEWKTRGLQNYGLVASSTDGRSAQVIKFTLLYLSPFFCLIQIFYNFSGRKGQLYDCLSDA
jgi:hypothetical protein